MDPHPIFPSFLCFLPRPPGRRMEILRRTSTLLYRTVLRSPLPLQSRPSPWSLSSSFSSVVISPYFMISPKCGLGTFDSLFGFFFSFPFALLPPLLFALIDGSLHLFGPTGSCAGAAFFCPVPRQISFLFSRSSPFSCFWGPRLPALTLSFPFGGCFFFRFSTQS